MDLTKFKPLLWINFPIVKRVEQRAQFWELNAVRIVRGEKVVSNMEKK